MNEKEEEQTNEECHLILEIIRLSKKIDWGDKIRDVIITHPITKWYGVG